MVVIPGAMESISAVRCAMDWPFHDLAVVERTRLNFSVSFVELGSVYAKHPLGYMGKPLFRPHGAHNCDGGIAVLHSVVLSS